MDCGLIGDSRQCDFTLDFTLDFFSTGHVGACRVLSFQRYATISHVEATGYRHVQDMTSTWRNSHNEKKLTPAHTQHTAVQERQQ